MMHFDLTRFRDDELPWMARAMVTFREHAPQVFGALISAIEAELLRRQDGGADPVEIALPLVERDELLQAGYFFRVHRDAALVIGLHVVAELFEALRAAVVAHLDTLPERSGTIH